MQKNSTYQRTTSMKENKYIHVRVTTKARTECILEKNGTFFIQVKEKAERGEANKRVRELLAQTQNCKPEELRLVKGGRSPSKTYLLSK